MNIQNAMKETGKAEDESCSTSYVKWNSDELWWYDRKTDNARRALHHCEILNDYIPYHPKEVIRPENAGELWRNGELYCHTDVRCDGLARNNGLVLIDSDRDSIRFDNVIHNQNGWTRLYPEVEAGEKVVIEGTNITKEAIVEKVIKLSKHEIQSGLTRVGNAEGLILQLPETHEGRNTWLLNYGQGAVAEERRRTDNDRRKDEGYAPRDLVWNEDTECLDSVN